MNNEHWRGKSYSFFANKACEYFPCHATDDVESFSCLFCYCPLYALGSECGGNPSYMANGTKDCSDCLLPHMRDNYGLVIQQLHDAADKARGSSQ